MCCRWRLQKVAKLDAEVNALGRTLGNKLQAASRGGHGAIVRLLLDRGAEVNAEGVGTHCRRRLVSAAKSLYNCCWKKVLRSTQEEETAGLRCRRRLKMITKPS